MSDVGVSPLAWWGFGFGESFGAQFVASELLEAFHAREVADLIRELVRLVMQDLIELTWSNASASAVTSGPHSHDSAQRVSAGAGRHSGRRCRAGDPKAAAGIVFPVILEPRRRIDQALYAVVRVAYGNGVSTQAVDDMVAALGVNSGISRSAGCKG